MEKKSVRPTVNYKDLMNLGFPEHSAREIIRQAKQIAAKQYEETRNNEKNMVVLRKSPFDNKRLGIAPTSIVEELIGIPFSHYLGNEVLK